jgi:predicted Co/Zn/Cd cation transporter (cation efflux family)
MVIKMSTSIKQSYLDYRAFVLAAISSILFVTISTIAAELNSAFKSLLATVFTHHWIGKSVLASVLFVAIFLVSAYALAQQETQKEVNYLNWTLLLLAIVIIGQVSITGFYAWNFFVFH